FTTTALLSGFSASMPKRLARLRPNGVWIATKRKRAAGSRAMMNCTQREHSTHTPSNRTRRSGTSAAGTGRQSRLSIVVIAGLDPAIHQSSQEAATSSLNDIIVKVPPLGIHLHDQVDLPLAWPVLDVFLALDCRLYRGMLLVIDQHLHAVPFGEAWCQSLAVFEDASDEVIGYADVKRSARSARQNVDPVAHT